MDFSAHGMQTQVWFGNKARSNQWYNSTWINKNDLVFLDLVITIYALQFHQNESWLDFLSHFLFCDEGYRNLSKSFCTFSIKMGC